jgi:hypothetical protein
LQNSRDVYDWLQNGAHLYVCGDADHMAVDVNEALLSVVRLEGALNDDAAQGGFNCGFGRNVWNNSERDPAVLFDASGVEVSRRE